MGPDSETLSRDRKAITVNMYFCPVCRRPVPLADPEARLLHSCVVDEVVSIPATATPSSAAVDDWAAEWEGRLALPSS